MKRLALFALLALGACSQQGRPQGPRFNTAQPGEVIAAELGFARLAQERGQWTAFRETAADDAEMFVPQRVNAQQWLRGRADPPVSVRWSPQAVWVSCDGSFAVTKGNWTGPNSSGTFATVWQRQPRGGYKWVLDMSLTDGQVDRVAADTIAAAVADCSGTEPQPLTTFSYSGLDLRFGASTDRSLRWQSRVRPDGSREIEVNLRKGTAWETVLVLNGRSD